MTNVVSFAKPEPLVWVCSCGCSTHRLYTTGAIECASCENIASVSGGDWVKELPEPSAEPKKVLPETKVISMAGTPAAALQTMLRHVNPDELVALVAIMENGRVRSWGGIDTQERVEWLDRRLADARDLLTSFVPKSETEGKP
jgi:hypothetical protein